MYSHALHYIYGTHVSLERKKRYVNTQLPRIFFFNKIINIKWNIIINKNIQKKMRQINLT